MDSTEELLREALLNIPPKKELKVEKFELDKESTVPARFQPLNFTNAVDFLYTFDRALREGKKSLHPWQVEVLLFLSNKKDGQFTIDLPLVFYLLACNGSGKDAYIIAGFSAFVLCCWPRYKIVITSSSDQQLDTQTRSYIKNLCEEVNTELRTQWNIPDVIKIKTETFKSQTFKQSNGATFSLTGSEILTFVTKEGGKAEGHHPYPDAAPGEGVILVSNEAKTVPQEIFDHFGKCTFNIFLKVSSSGAAKEHFYSGFTRARDWQEGYIPGVPFKRKITYKDCPHISNSRIQTEIVEHGEDSAWFRMTRKSEFVSEDDCNVISDPKLTKCRDNPRSKIDLGLPRKAGLDIGGGGDPSSLWVFDNNICIGKERWSYKDTQLTVDLLVGDEERQGLFNKYGLKAENIIGDDNGIGQGVLDNLRRRGWAIRQQRAQFAAINKIKYLNRGAEWWFRFLRLIEEQIINFNGHLTQDIFRQLVSRHYSDTNGKLKLWSKQEEASAGNPSPNDADAIVLAFSDVDIYEFIEQKEKGKIVETAVRAEVLGSKVIVDSVAHMRNNHMLMQLQEMHQKEFKDNSKDINSLINSIYG